MLNGIIRNNGKKLKNDNADFPKTKLTIVDRFTGSVNSGFILITGSF
jgi:hypothetical protein